MDVEIDTLTLTLRSTFSTPFLRPSAGEHFSIIKNDSLKLNARRDCPRCYVYCCAFSRDMSYTGLEYLPAGVFSGLSGLTKLCVHLLRSRIGSMTVSFAVKSKIERQPVTPFRTRRGGAKTKPD